MDRNTEIGGRVRNGLRFRGTVRGEVKVERSFRLIFLTIAIIGSITWLAILEHNYHSRIYRYKEGVTIFQVGESELDFNHPPGLSST